MQLFYILLICIASVQYHFVLARHNCDSTKKYFIGQTIPDSPVGRPDSICGSGDNCCTNVAQITMINESRNELINLIKSTVQPFTGSFYPNLKTFTDSIVSNLIIIEDEALNLFQMFKPNEPIHDATRPPVNKLFRRLTKYLTGQDNIDDKIVGDQLKSGQIMRDFVFEFLVELFPVLFTMHEQTHQISPVKLVVADVSTTYGSCLQRTYTNILTNSQNRIIKDINLSISQLERRLTPLRLTVVTLRQLTQAINLIQLNASKYCDVQLTRLFLCEKCLPNSAVTMTTSTKPCKSFCSTVIDTCSLTSIDSSHWSSIDAAINIVEKFNEKQRDSRAVDTFDQMMTKLQTEFFSMCRKIALSSHFSAFLKPKMKSKCGSTPILNMTTQALSPKKPIAIIERSVVKSISKPQLISLLGTLNETTQVLKNVIREQHTKLAGICDDHISDKDDNCWNGTEIGRYSALVGSKLHVSVDNVQPFKEEQTSGENVYSKLKLTTEALDSVRVFSNSDPIIPNIIDDDDYDNDNIMTDHSFADDYREKFLSNGHFRGIDDNEYDSTDEEMDASGDNEIIDKPVVPSPEESIYKPEENANLNIPLTGYEGQPKASTGQPKTTAGQTKATTGQPTTTLGQPTTTLGQPKTTLGQVSHAPGQLPEAATTTEPTTTTESRCSRTMVNFYTLFISVFTVSFFWQKYFYSELIWR